MAIFPFSRDLAPVLLLLLTAFVWKRHFYMRGLTYRSSVVPVGRERALKSLFYVGLLGVVDAVLRRLGQLLSRLPFFSQVLPRSETTALVLRLLLLHMPWALWALRGPLSERGSTRDDRGWSDAVTRWSMWKRLAACFGHTSVVLSEEWRDLSESERRRWYDRHYVIAMHPHGLLPFGAILNGLTWAGGGLRGVTASGATLPEPENGGELLHQKWFRHMKLRAAVASGACGLFPGFYEMFTTLGAFECTKPFIQEVLRQGKDVAIFVGGAKESCYASPGRYVCFVSTHKGFVRLALEEHRDILPMWTFGDESILPQMVNPRLGASGVLRTATLGAIDDGHRPAVRFRGAASLYPWKTCGLPSWVEPSQMRRSMRRGREFSADDARFWIKAPWHRKAIRAARMAGSAQPCRASATGQAGQRRLATGPKEPGLVRNGLERQQLLLAELIERQEDPLDEQLHRLLGMLLEDPCCDGPERSEASQSDGWQQESRPQSNSSRSARPRPKPTPKPGADKSVKSAEDKLARELEGLIQSKDWLQVKRKIKLGVWRLACCQSGSRQLQQLLKKSCRVGPNATEPEKKAAEEWRAAVDIVIAELRTHVLQVTAAREVSNFSNYVLQACIQELSPERFSFILEEMKNHVAKVAVDPQGCRVMQRIIEHVGDKDEYTMPLLQEILPKLKEVAMDRYGNHVVQKFLEMASENQRSALVQELFQLGQMPGQLSELAMGRYSSHVLENAVVNTSPELRHEFIAILEKELHRKKANHDGTPGRMQKKTEFGSFVWRCLRKIQQESPKVASNTPKPAFPSEEPRPTAPAPASAAAAAAPAPTAPAAPAAAHAQVVAPCMTLSYPILVPSIPVYPVWPHSRTPRADLPGQPGFAMSPALSCIFLFRYPTGDGQMHAEVLKADVSQFHQVAKEQ
ncbi:unnamed protein product [Effrenium voratum]|nr:unnamed protein product [Effrenium voratum]